MPESSGIDAPAVRGAFVLRFIEDRAVGVARRLEEYQRLYPGCESVIAAEFETLSEPAPETAALAPFANDPDSVLPAALSDGRVAHFRLLREIGRGGQGAVYLAHDVRLGRKVALNILRGRGEEEMRLFKEEAETTSRLNLPGVCAVFDAGFDDGFAWIAMSYVEGASLARRNRDSKNAASPGVVATSLPEVKPDEPRELDRPAAEAACVRAALFIERAARLVHLAHEAGIAHQDLKPGNLMISHEGTPVVLDFGIARREDAALASGSIGIESDVRGTPHYMATERFSAEAAPGRSGDVYALGAVLFEMLALRTPFQGATTDELIAAAQRDRAPDVRSFNAAVPPVLAAIVACALSKDAARRYRSAEALAEDLRRFRRSEPVSAVPAGAVRRFRLWVLREPRFASAAGLVSALLVVALAIVATWLVREQADRERIEALSDLERSRDLEREEEGLYPAEPNWIAAMAAWLDDARRLIDRAPYHRAEAERLSPRVRRSERAPPFSRDSAMTGFDTSASAALDADIERQLRGIYGAIDPTRAEALLARLRSWPTPPLSWERDPGPTASFVSDDPADAWRYELHQEIAGGLARLEQSATWVRFQRDAAMPKTGASEADAASRRAAACAEIADSSRCPAYGGLRLTRQYGLLPSGRDPDSGLHEFWAEGTGRPPVRDASGRWIPEDASALVLVLIPGGRTTVGAPRDRDDSFFDPEAHGAEVPSCSVRFDPYFIAKCELTIGQWCMIAADRPNRYTPGWNPAGAGDPTYRSVTIGHPVENVSWERCAHVLRSVGLAVPTEAQWDHAARAGTRTRDWTGDDAKSLEGAANLLDSEYARFDYAELYRPPEDFFDGFPLHAPTFWGRANAFGLYGVHGNVAEWCREWSRYGHESAPPRDGDGFEVGGGQNARMVRGGGFLDGFHMRRVTARRKESPLFASKDVGVRPVRPIR